MEIDEINKLLNGKTIATITDKPSEKETEARYDDSACVAGVGDADDYGAIIIRFTDGTYVHIWSSEWGGIAYGKSTKG